MEVNSTNHKSNVTLDQVIDYFNLNLTNVNQSEVAQTHLFDLYEAYRTIEREQLMVYRSVAYILGALIILSNLTVVISSGLILKKGQQPKSTYLLLGNVSLADTIIGFSLIFGVTVDNSISSNSLCIFQIGMLVCPAMVSIFSVGLIAVDRYIYILHGLYYQRWFNTTRVRIGIVCIWIIGVTLGFMPATGWTNTELNFTRCYYVALFPNTLILLNSFLSIIPIIVVAVLYSIILIKALKTANTLNKGVKNIKLNAESRENSNLRISRGNDKHKTQSVHISAKPKPPLKRSASFTLNYKNEVHINNKPFKSKNSNSIDDLTANGKTNITSGYKNIDKQSKTPRGSTFSVCTKQSRVSDNNISVIDINSPGSLKQPRHKYVIKLAPRLKEPNRWRAITVVMLTSGSFIVTWMPFFITVTSFVFCEQKLLNPKCLHYRSLLGGPLATLAFINSILNPLIYAWWHKGFQNSVKAYYRRYIHINITSDGLDGENFQGISMLVHRCVP